MVTEEKSDRKNSHRNVVNKLSFIPVICFYGIAG